MTIINQVTYLIFLLPSYNNSAKQFFLNLLRKGDFPYVARASFYFKLYIYFEWRTTGHLYKGLKLRVIDSTWTTTGHLYKGLRLRVTKISWTNANAFLIFTFSGMLATAKLQWFLLWIGNKTKSFRNIST